VKQCRQSSDISEKNKSRWCQECDIMLRLDHPNVVRGIVLPDEVKCQLTEGDMPVLAMEYCQLGDLRRVTRTVCKHKLSITHWIDLRSL